MMQYSWRISSRKLEIGMMMDLVRSFVRVCECITHEEDSNEEEECVEVASKTEIIVEFAPIQDVIPANVDLVALPVQPTNNEVFIQGHPILGKKRKKINQA